MFLFLLYIVKFFKEVGFLNGVVNFVLGFGFEVGVVIVNYYDIDKVVFIGFIVIGKYIMC